MASEQLVVDVLVIGGGFGGLYSIWKFRNLGLKVHLFEAGSSYGGVWYHNSYPGARVDSEFPFYQLSIPEVYQTWEVSERFPGYAEIRRYFEHIDKVLDARKDTTFHAEVTDAHFDESSKTWTVRTANGHIAICRYLILCTGSTYRKYTPQFPNMAVYKGALHHTSQWPEGGLSVKGKKVCVIGAGSTAVQVVQEFAKEVKEMTVLIRTPNTALPLKQRKISREEQHAMKGWMGRILRGPCRTSFGGFPYDPQPTPTTFSVSPEERETIYEQLYQRGGFNLAGSAWSDTLVDPKANRAMYDFWATKTRARIRDPAKRDILAPLEPQHPIMCKRHSLESDYYECMDQDNVRVVDLRANPITSFAEQGITIAKGSASETINADVVVLATGYDNYTGAFLTMGLKDVNGNDLARSWQDGVQTYLGLMCSGYPNMWMIYGPQAPTALGNGPTIIEVQIDIVADMIGKMREEGISSLTPTEDASREWTAQIEADCKATLMDQADSWYMGANVPGKKRQMLNYLRGLVPYEQACRDALATWKGFDVVKN